jgi:hypothetical protein
MQLMEEKPLDAPKNLFAASGEEFTHGRIIKLSLVGRVEQT